MHKANTIEEANNQEIKLSLSMDNWAEFSSLIDGYKIAEELEVNLIQWGEKQEKLFLEVNEWQLNTLELRLMLFYFNRWLYFSGFTYKEKDELIQSILNKLNAK